MRLSSLLLFVALLAGGCATRLPLEDGARSAAQEPSTTLSTTVSTMLSAIPAPEEEVGRSGRRLSLSHACFVPCGSAGGEGAEEFKRHEFAVFLGYTSERGEGGPTIGLDYTYWINERFGVGPFVDFVAGEIEAFAVGAGVWFRPSTRLEGLALYVAPGLDIVHEKEHGTEEGRSWEVKALLRLGAVYGFDVGGGLPARSVFLPGPDRPRRAGLRDGTHHRQGVLTRGAGTG